MINIISKQMKAIEPDYAAVAFDLKAPTFRHKMYDGYKAGRHPTPPELLSQFADAKECLTLLGIHVMELEGYEADDIQGTVAAMAHTADEETESYILSGDRDLLQLIDDKITVLLATTGDTIPYREEQFIEKYSVLRAHMAVERADVCLIMIDAGTGITEQDEKIAGIAHEAGKACIIVVNKWDSIEKDNSTVNSFNERIRTALAYMPYAPIVYVSALTGQRVTTLFEHIKYVHNQANTRISTGMLNDVLAEATMRVQPPSDKGKRLKIYYMTQASVAPPTFVLFCNDAELFHFSYQRYIENCLRQTFGFSGTPIRLTIRMKGDNK